MPRRGDGIGRWPSSANVGTAIAASEVNSERHLAELTATFACLERRMLRRTMDGSGTSVSFGSDAVLVPPS
jgi:hypothetical protein